MNRLSSFLKQRLIPPSSLVQQTLGLLNHLNPFFIVRHNRDRLLHAWENSRDHQLVLDLIQIAKACTVYTQNHMLMDYRNTVGEDVGAERYEYGEGDKAPLQWIKLEDQLKVHNMRIIQPQVLAMFEKVVRGYSFSPYVIPLQEQKVLHSEEDANLGSLFQFKGDNSNIPIIHPHNFVLKIKRSSVDHPEAGYGVFVEGEIVPGTLVCIYPGKLYHPTDWERDPSLLKSDTMYMIARYDGTVIDGRRWELEAFNLLKKIEGFERAGADVATDLLKRFKNPYGIGHYINHPPKDCQANVMPYSFVFPEIFEEEYKDYIPNMDIEARKEVDKFYEIEGDRVYSKAIFLISTSFIKDEELFLNYRFPPDYKAPSWYQPVNLEVDARRWTHSYWYNKKNKGR